MLNHKLKELREAAQSGRATLFYTDAQGVQHAVNAAQIGILVSEAIERRAQVDRSNADRARQALAASSPTIVRPQHTYAEL